MKPIHLSEDSTGKRPFTVPEGYFEAVQQAVLDRIDAAAPRPVRVTLYQRVKPYIYLAAMICGLAFGVEVYKFAQQRAQDQAAQPQEDGALMTKEQSDAYADDVYNYMMLDAHDVFACATESSYPY